MKQKQNSLNNCERFLQKLRSAEPAVGMCIALRDSLISEMVGEMGYDFTWIDCEHGAITIADALDHVMAVRGTNAAPLIRVPSHDPVVIKPYLECAPAGIIVPRVRSADKVRSAVSACRYPPAGRPDRRERSYSASDQCGFDAQDAFYAISKNLGEEVFKAYHEAHGLSVINLRPGVIAGDEANGEPTAPKGERPPFWFVYVHPEDVAQAVERAVDQDTVSYGTHCIVAGRSDSLFDWREAAERVGYAPEHNWEEIK